MSTDTDSRRQGHSKLVVDKGAIKTVDPHPDTDSRFPLVECPLCGTTQPPLGSLHPSSCPAHEVATCVACHVSGDLDEKKHWISSPTGGAFD